MYAYVSFADAKIQHVNIYAAGIECCILVALLTKIFKSTPF